MQRLYLLTVLLDLLTLMCVHGMCVLFHQKSSTDTFLLEVGEPCSEESEGELGSSQSVGVKTFTIQSNNTPKKHVPSKRIEVKVGSPRWKKHVRSPSLEVEVGTPMKGLYAEAQLLDDIHKAVLSLHSRIDAVEDTMQQFIDSSFFVRQSTPISSSHGTTASSGSESAGSFQIQAEDYDFSELPFSKVSKRPTDVLHGCPSSTPDTCNVKDSKVGLTHSQLCDASTSAGNVERQSVKQVIDAACIQLGMSPNFARVLDKKIVAQEKIWLPNLFDRCFLHWRENHLMSWG